MRKLISLGAVVLILALALTVTAIPVGQNDADAQAFPGERPIDVQRAAATFGGTLQEPGVTSSGSGIIVEGEPEPPSAVTCGSLNPESPLTSGTGRRHLRHGKLRSMRIVEPEPAVLCQPCAQRRRRSLRYCEGDAHQLLPECPENQVPLRWTNGGETASCNLPTGTNSRGRRTWCRPGSGPPIPSGGASGGSSGIASETRGHDRYDRSGGSWDGHPPSPVPLLRRGPGCPGSDRGRRARAWKPRR